MSNEEQAAVPRAMIETLKERMKISGVGAEDSKPNKKTESNIAMEFADALRAGDFRHGPGGLMWFNGVKYEPIYNSQIRSALHECLRFLSVGSVYIVNSLSQIIQTGMDSIRMTPFTPNRGLVSFRNGTINLDTMELTTPTTEDMETYIFIDTDYDPKADCPKFKEFLMQVLPDSDSQRIVQEFCGAVFVNRRKYNIQKLLYLLGDGQNGKGVFLECIQSVLGNSNCTNFSMSDVCTSSHRMSNIARCSGKLVNICYDMSKDDVSGGEFKRFVSGEAMEGRYMYKDTFTVTDLPLVIAAVNEVPATTDHSFGHARRHLIIPFEIRIPAEMVNPTLAKELVLEAPGILNWMFHGRSRFLANGAKFSQSEKIDQLSKDVRRKGNSILSFCYENQYFGKKMAGTIRCERSNEELYREYVAYCKANGNMVSSASTFSNNLARMQDLEFESIRMGNGTRGKAFYKPLEGYVYDDEKKKMVPIDEIIVSQLAEDEKEDDLPF